MKQVATIILNRNLPQETDYLYEHVCKYNSDFTDIFVIEAGSEANNLSKYTTWHVNDPFTIAHGLRYSRGMNYALLQLYEQGLWEEVRLFSTFD